MKKHSAFTLLEMLVTLLMISVLLAIGVPAMRDFVKNDRLSTQINTLIGHLALARSEAVKRHLPVVICASTNQATCNSADWADGWIVFADLDGNSDFSAGDEMLRQKTALDGSMTLNSTAGAIVNYDFRGFAPASNGVFALCDDRGDAHVKSISISNTGRVRQGGSSTCA